MRIGRVRDALV